MRRDSTSFHLVHSVPPPTTTQADLSTNIRISSSEQSSPASMYDRNADDIMMVEYHSRRTTGTSPRRDRTTWVH
ncbi:hypothetical protein ANCCAN_03667 [Ancylostoma caninum]|uniref:Uncharacterized protein n=1 Tax=Ancylostoma caninum TaxID=29170 RepID=A0A368H4N7_ANCCA|nr:hypothetical protein ANCCAN_03667 [Ancylostoma caninum]